jgi:hypothetical protein
VILKWLLYNLIMKKKNDIFSYCFHFCYFSAFVMCGFRSCLRRVQGHFTKGEFYLWYAFLHGASFFYFIYNFNTIVRPLENYQMGLINSKHAKCSCDTFCQGLHNICKIRTTNHNYIYIMWGAKETCRLGRNLVTGVFTADYIDSWSAE